jgi:hypothetical protein
MALTRPAGLRVPVEEPGASSNTAEAGVNEDEGLAAAGIDRLTPNWLGHTVYATLSAL